MLPYILPFLLAVILLCDLWFHDVGYHCQEARAGK
jgi:hypothetical protein